MITLIGAASKKSLSTGAYVGIGIGSVAVLAVVFIAIRGKSYCFPLGGNMGAVPYLLFNLSSAGEEAFTLRLLIRNMNDRAIYSLTFFCNEIKVFRRKKWQVKKEISAFSSKSKLSFIWLTRLSAMKALRDPCIHTTLLSPFRREF